MLLRAIEMVVRPYANVTATTQETVSQVLSSNLSSINNNGELLASCLYSGDCSKQLPSLFPLVRKGQMHGKWRTGYEGGVHDNRQTRPWSSWYWG